MSSEKPVSPSKSKKKSRHSRSKGDKIIAASLVGTTPRPVYFVSPVYMPYVQAPVCYVKSSKSSNQTLKSKDDSAKLMKKRSSEAAPSLRYVPHPSCVPAPAPNCVPVPAYNYVPTPTYYQPNYALRNGQVVQVGAVVRPYPQPYVTLTPGWVSYSPTVQHQHCSGSNKSSKLNPLSEPYQPKKTTSEDNDDSRSNCSTPEWMKNTEELASVSRAETPASSTHLSEVCPKCGGQLNGSHDTDSGVGDEGDELVCCCKETASNSDLTEDEQELHIPSLQSLEELPSGEVVQLIEFICERLQPHEWRAVARELGVSDVIIQCIEYDVYESVQEQMKYVFSYWARSRSMTDLSEDDITAVQKSFVEIGRNDLASALEEESFCSS